MGLGFIVGCIVPKIAIPHSHLQPMENHRSTLNFFRNEAFAYPRMLAVDTGTYNRCQHFEK
jgi:hypothetical protein